MIGYRHSESCRCGCSFVVGVPGEVVERHDDMQLAVVRFEVPCPAGGPAHTHLVAYALDSVTA